MERLGAGVNAPTTEALRVLVAVAGDLPPSEQPYFWQGVAENLDAEISRRIEAMRPAAIDCLDFAIGCLRPPGRELK